MSGKGLVARTMLFAGTLLTLVPQALWACAVCSDPNDKNRVAFLATTGFLSLMPLSLVAGLIGWLKRRAEEE